MRSLSRVMAGGPDQAGYVLWVSTSRSTRGGVSAMVNTVMATELTDVWHIVHVATHRDGPATVKVAAFAIGGVRYLGLMVFRRPRLVHIHTASYGSFVRKSLLVWVAVALRVPVVLHVHGAEFHLFVGSLPRLLQRYVSVTISRCRAVVALGPGWAERITAIAPAASVVVVPNAVRPRAAVARSGGAGAVRALFLGRVGDRKGTFDLIAAWHAMIENGVGASAHLTVAGDGEVDRARQMVDDLGIGDHVRVTGWVDPAEVPALIADADILVLPSHDEGQPMALLEAMAEGLCVVTSPVGGIPDVVDETCAVLVDPGDVDGLCAALTRVVTIPGLRSSLGDAALERVRSTFDVDVVWRQLDRLYTEVAR